MVVLSLLKKSLVLFQYPRFPPMLEGSYDVGTLKTRMSQELVGCQIYYPIQKEQQREENFLSYWREEAVKGLTKYTRTTEGLLDFLSARKSPYPYGQNIFVDNDGSGSYPVILFSHGLSGCMEMYSQLCCTMASYGYIVFALEHEDGSGCYAETVDGEPIYYKVPDDTPYSREKVIKFRGPMLAQRTQEIEKMMKYIMDETTMLTKSKKDDIDNSEEGNDNNVQLLQRKILSAAKIDDGFSLVGHSFGAATMALVAQRNSLHTNSLAMMDPWCFSMTDADLDKGITEIPLLTILSEGWTKSKNYHK